MPGHLAQRAIKMAKTDTADWNSPNGTGPWKFVSWTRGKRSLFERHDGYRMHGGPYLEQLEVIGIADPTARVNALAGGQIEALQLLPPNLVKTVQANPKLRVLMAQTGGFTPQTMRTDAAPFRDNRVRQAMRLLTDRQQIIKNALSGYGRIGNDLFCPYDPSYASSLPQRPYDPERARSLLKAAGQEGATFELYTANAANAMLESSTLIAEQAKKAGLTIKLDQVPTDQYWSLKYLKAPFACSGWGQRSLESQILQAVDTKAPYNETGWRNPAFDRLTAAARKTLDAKKRKQLYFQAQKMLYDEGGFLIWGFPHHIDAYTARLKGLKKSTARNLGFYNFTDAYFE
jgi:peptide/nickel transport system substrate-binding protein